MCMCICMCMYMLTIVCVCVSVCVCMCVPCTYDYHIDPIYHHTKTYHSRILIPVSYFCGSSVLLPPKVEIPTQTDITIPKPRQNSTKPHYPLITTFVYQDDLSYVYYGFWLCGASSTYHKRKTINLRRNRSSVPKI